MNYVCPVCGYANLDRTPYRENKEPSYDICPSCSFQYGKTDDDEGYNFETWRLKWIREGMIWDKNYTSPPLGWDPKKQLLNIGIKI